MQDAVENGDGRHECEISICMLCVYMEGDSEQIEMREKENKMYKICVKCKAGMIKHLRYFYLFVLMDDLGSISLI